MVVALLVSACAGDDGTSSGDADTGRSGEDAYVTALASRWDEEEGNQFTPAENRCAAEAYLDVLGLESLRQAVSADEFGNAPDKNLVDFGVEIDEEQARSIYEASQGCGDQRGAFLDDLTQALEGPLMAEVDEACLDQSLDDTDLETFVVEQLQRGKSGPLSQRTPEMAEAYVGWIGECVDLRAALVTSLQAGVQDEASPEGLTCLDQQIDDDLARQAWIELFIGEPPSVADSALGSVIEQCESPGPS